MKTDFSDTAFGVAQLTQLSNMFNISSMPQEDLLKLFIGVTSAFAGWVLAQFTNVVTAWLQRLKIKRLLLEELEDLEMELKRVMRFYERQLQLYGARGISNESSARFVQPHFQELLQRCAPLVEPATKNLLPVDPLNGRSDEYRITRTEGNDLRDSERAL